MSMIEYPIDKLEEKCGTRYALAVVTAKRSKELLQGQKPLVTPREDEKVISVAAKEIFHGKVYPIIEDEQ